MDWGDMVNTLVNVVTLLVGFWGAHSTMKKDMKKHSRNNAQQMIEALNNIREILSGDDNGNGSDDDGKDSKSPKGNRKSNSRPS